MEATSDIFWIVISSTIIFLVLLAFIISLLFMYQRRQNRYQLEIRKMKADYEAEILRTQLEIKEQTFKYISQELHDNVGQVLSLATLTLSSVELDYRDIARQKIENILNLIGGAVADLRSISKSLDPDNISKAELSACIQIELGLLEKTGHYKTMFDVTGREREIGAEKKLIIFRIIQEALNNVIKHSQASAIVVELRYEQETVQVKITDNGIGFEPGTAGSYTGAGLNNMRNRARIIQGSLNIRSVPTKGTTVSLLANT